MTDRKADATYHPGSTPEHPLPTRSPMESMASWGEPPPPDAPVDRMQYDSPGPAPWAPPMTDGPRPKLPTLAWVALLVGSIALLTGAVAVISLVEESGPVPVLSEVHPQVTTTGTCEKRIIGEYGLVATVTATNGTNKPQSGQVWVLWPVTGEASQRFVKPVTLAPGEVVEFPVNQDIPAERWYRTGLCTFGWEPQDGQGGGLAIDWGKPETLAPNRRVIEVVDKISPTAWRVGTAVNWLDRYTASDMRLVKKCTGKAYRCITVRQGKVKGKPVGWSQGATITIDTGKAKRGVYARWYRSDKNRTWLLIHELGHQHSLGHSTGRNVMNEYVNRYKKVLTSGQRATLRKR